MFSTQSNEYGAIAGAFENESARDERISEDERAHEDESARVKLKGLYNHEFTYVEANGQTRKEGRCDVFVRASEELSVCARASEIERKRESE